MAAVVLNGPDTLTSEDQHACEDRDGTALGFGMNFESVVVGIATEMDFITLVSNIC